MGKTLIIAEKPSVMTDLARALAKPLGKFEKEGSGRDVYFENDKAVITSAVGHLVELRMPMGPNGKKLPWNFQEGSLKTRHRKLGIQIVIEYRVIYAESHSHDDSRRHKEF